MTVICDTCNRELHGKETVYTEIKGFQRFDWCESCWRTRSIMDAMFKKEIK